MDHRSTFRLAFAAIFCLIIFSLPLKAQVFVNLNANGANDGSSWADAYTSLQTALANTGSGEIWVAQGAYKPVSCNPCQEADKEMAFVIPPDVQLFGGFAGGEGEKSQRDWENNPTILSGDIGVQNDSTDNSYKVIIAVNSTASTVLDGFIIEEGNADGSFGFSSGGGLYLDAQNNGAADMQVRNCIFRRNYAGGGGAVAINCVLGGKSDALFYNCLFEENTASLRVVSTGGAVFMQGNSGALLRPKFVSCTFQNNFSGNDGGAFSATPTGEGSLLAFEIDSCRFENNRARDRGAAVWYRMSSSGTSEVVIKNSRFIGNEGGGQGGAIFARSSFDNVANDIILNCLFSQNRTDGGSEQNDGEGGAIFLRGSQNGSRNQQIVNCVFDRNFASQRGGAIGTTSMVSGAGNCNAQIINCTFFGNKTGGEGGAIHAEGSEGVNEMEINNSIFWRDSTAVSGNEVVGNNSSITASFNNFDGGLPPGLIDNGNNFDLEPGFADPGQGDLRLLRSSNLLNAGNNNAIPSFVLTDLDGDQRIDQGTVDLGAYETGIIYVDWTAGSGAQTGTSWADAFLRFQDGLEAAHAGDQIWVAQGTYLPLECNPCGEEDKEAAFFMKKNVEALGGFSGNETQVDQRDWENNPTILSGDIGVSGDSLDNVFKVIIAVNATANTILDGFIIEEGNADGSFGFSSGGGLYLDAQNNGAADMQVRNCTFRRNYAGGGGAVAINCVLGGKSDALFYNCLFEENTASLRVVSTGGAVFMQGNSGAILKPRFVQCTFRNNYSGNDGGAFSATPTGEGSLLAFEIDSCRFENNRARDRGAAVWYRMSSSGQSRVVIKNSEFFDNQGGGQGAAIFARSSFDNVANDTIINCLFSQNRTDGGSEQNDGVGGAIFLRGSQNGSRTHHIINCVFDHNFASEGGGAIGTTSFVSGAGNCTTEIINCTFFENLTDGEGNTIHAQGSQGANQMNVLNSILWGDDENIIVNNNALVTVAFSGIQGGLPDNVDDGGGNQFEDPQFIDSQSDDFRLSSCSPAINAGLNEVIPQDLIDLDQDGDFDENISLDFAGEDRINQGLVDLGAIEWNGEPPALTITVDSTDITCESLCDGSATVNVEGGVPDYTFEWSDGQTTATASGLCAGVYHVTISDDFGCVLEDSVIINEATDNPIPPVEISGSTSFCTGNTTLLDAGEGYNTYEWSNGSTEQVLNVESEGIYRVTVTDERGCQDSTQVEVTENESLQPVINGNLFFCEGMTTTLTAGDFVSYRWSTGDTTSEITVVQPGEYSVMVSDSSGCMGENSVNVVANPNPQPEISGSLTFCTGTSTLLDAGDGYASYEWSDGSTGQSLSVNTAGTYGVEVTDTNGCVGTTEVEVMQSDSLVPAISGELFFCPGGATELSAGNFDSYEWSTGETTASILVNTPGEYSVEVSDENGCAGKNAVRVQALERPEPEIEGNTTFCLGGQASLRADTTYSTYLWSDGSTGRELTTNFMGLVTLRITDNNGCEGVDSVQLTMDDNPPRVSLDSSMMLTCRDSCVTLSAEVEGATDYSINWSSESGLFAAPPGALTVQVCREDVYYVAVRDNISACRARDTLFVGENRNLPNISFDETPPSFGCETEQLSIRANVEAQGIAEIKWSTQNGGNINPIGDSLTVEVDAPGFYTLTVTGINGCSSSSSINVESDQDFPLADAGEDFDILCGQTATLDGSNSSKEGDLSFSWNALTGTIRGGEDGLMPEVAEPGVYVLQITNQNNGCSATDTVRVSRKFPPDADAGQDLPTCLDQAMLSANQPEGTQGRWTSAEGPFIEQADSNRTLVFGLSPGEQAFNWTLSAPGCPDYSSDEVIVILTQSPVANDDVVNILAGADRSIGVDLTQNDLLSFVGEWEITILQQPAIGFIDSLGQGRLFYTAPDGAFGSTSIVYQLCSLECPDQCSEATVNITIEKEDITAEDIPNAITPNDDGLNDAFIFDILEVNSPEQFPDNELIIFNRWGDIVFRQKDYDNSWNGVNQKGEVLPTGTYYYILRLNLEDGVILKGDVSIIK